ncbi:MAG TPA: peptidylprolyl isomerase [Kofleriaceae bacterium]|nr:peptidylprolyl isomerase [Kofleriaceae bacterium]
MLEQLRRNSRSFIIWILFGIIIAVFIISFGPQANPESLGCGHANEFALEVTGEDVSVNSWRFGVNGVNWLRLRGGGQDASYRRQLALDLLVQRELLAQAAEDRGFRVPDDLVNKAIAAGEFYILGYKVRINDRDFFRDYKQLESFATSLGLPNVAQLLEEQRREQLAEMTRHLFLAAAAVSDEEVKQAFVQENTKISADYVKFDVARYKNALSLGEEEIAKYAAENDAELKKAWESEKTQWTNDRARVLARHIFIAKEEAKPPAEDKPADEATDKPEEDPAAAAGKKEEARAAAAAKARDEAKAVHARLAAGEDFAKVAREVSDDPLTRARGGVLGWRPAESLGYGKEVVEATKKLEVGKLSEPIETPRGFHIVRIDEKSDKGLTYEQKKLDLAAKTAADHYARQLAKRDAEAALAQAKQKPLDQLFERKAPPQPMPFPGGQLPENITPEMLEQLMKEAAEAGEEGVIFREGPNVLAQAGGTTPTTQPSAPPATPAPAKPAPARPAPAKAPATTPAAPADAGGLPAVTVEKPGLETIGPVSRSRDFLAGVGRSEELLTDLFEKIEVGKLGDKVYEVSDTSDAYVIVQLKEREDADMSKFDEDRERLKSEIAFEKGVTRLSAWLVDRCVKSSKAGDIRINPSVLQDDDSGKKVEYRACASINEMSLAGQLRSGRDTP